MMTNGESSRIVHFQDPDGFERLVTVKKREIKISDAVYAFLKSGINAPFSVPLGEDKDSPKLFIPSLADNVTRFSRMALYATGFLEAEEVGLHAIAPLGLVGRIKSHITGIPSGAQATLETPSMPPPTVKQ